MQNCLLLGNCTTAGPASSFLHGKPSSGTTRAQQLAIRRSVLHWGASAHLESSSAATDLFTEPVSGRAAGGGTVMLEQVIESAPRATQNDTITRTLEFVKYHGIGNDFIMDYCRSTTSIPPSPSLLLQRLFACATGIGGDGVIFVMRDGENFQMRIYNSDSTELEMCGNGIRCDAKFLAELQNASAPKSFKVRTLAGYMILELREDGQVCVDMGPPFLEAAEVPTKLAAKGEVIKAPLLVGGKTWLVTCVSMGNPHCITFGDDGGEGLNVDALPLEHVGPLFEHHEMFLARTNTDRCYPSLSDWGLCVSCCCSEGRTC